MLAPCAGCAALSLGNPRNALSLGAPAGCAAAVREALELLWSSSVSKGDGSGASLGMGLASTAAAEGIPAPGAAGGASMASRNFSAVTSSPEDVLSASAPLGSACASACCAVGLLSRWLAHLRKLACCAAGEGLPVLLAGVGAAAAAGCPICGSCSGLLASCALPWGPTNTKLASRDAPLRELSVVEPSLLAGEPARGGCGRPAANCCRRARSPEAPGWAAAARGGAALLALPQVLWAGRADELVLLGMGMAALPALPPAGGRGGAACGAVLPGWTSAAAGPAACTSCDEARAAERLASALRVGVAGVTGLLAASSAISCREQTELSGIGIGQGYCCP